MNIWAVIPAAGRSRRFGDRVPKQYRRIAGRYLIQHALDALLSHPDVAGAVVVVAAADARAERLQSQAGKPLIFATGGRERSDSVLSGLDALPEVDDSPWVLVHDAARPCLTRGDLDALLAVRETSDVGGLLATPLQDTLKRADADGSVIETVDRRHLWRALTPQFFPLPLLRRAIESARDKGLVITDEASAVERLGLQPRVIKGLGSNIKVTLTEDLPLAAAIWKLTQESGECE